MTYPGGSGQPIQTDTAAKQPKRIQKAVRVFQPVIRKITRSGRSR